MEHGLTTTRCLTCAILAGVVMLHAVSDTRADGKYFSGPTVAGETDPEMPFQRAIIAYRDGVETMTVESAVQGTGGDLGWVIPLPAEPTSITARKPGALRSVYQLIGPRIEIDSGVWLLGSAVLLIFVVLICMVVADNKRHPRSFGALLASVLGIVFLVLVVPGVLLPALGTAGESGPAGVEVLQHEQVGSYEVSIIKASTAEPLRQWLADNAFALPESAVPVLTAYAKAGWCFAVSRINSTETSVLSPHPLQFVFKTPEAVYPMKLTGVGARKMQLDLYVIGDEAATAEHLDRISCDTYRASLSYQRFRPFNVIRAAFKVTEFKSFKADHIGLRVGHPSITDLMWPGCTLTHLRGELAAADMSDDFVLGWEASGPVHKTRYTPEAARSVGYAAALGCAAVVLLTVVLWLAGRTGPRKGWRWFVGSLLVYAVFCSAVGMATYALIPKTPTRAVSPRGAISAHQNRTRQIARLYSILLYVADGSFTPDFAAFEQWWAVQLDEYDLKWMDRLSHPALDVPGGFTLERAGDDWQLTIYDHYATPQRFLFKATAPHSAD